jgi:hypothetical protein
MLLSEAQVTKENSVSTLQKESIKLRKYPRA